MTRRRTWSRNTRMSQYYLLFRLWQKLLFFRRDGGGGDSGQNFYPDYKQPWQ